MSFVDQPSGWQWPAMAATVLAQGALLAVFAAAFHVAQTVPDGSKAASLVAFDLSPPPVEAKVDAGAKGADDRPAPDRPIRPQPPALLMWPMRGCTSASKCAFTDRSVIQSG